MGAGPGSVVCLGDSLEWDVLGAQTAGLRAVWLDRAGAGTEQPVASVRGLDEVATALRADLGTRSGTGSIPLRFTTQKAARRARSETPWGMV